MTPVVAAAYHKHIKAQMVRLYAIRDRLFKRAIDIAKERGFDSAEYHKASKFAGETYDRAKVVSHEMEKEAAWINSVLEKCPAAMKRLKNALLEVAAAAEYAQQVYTARDAKEDLRRMEIWEQSYATLLAAPSIEALRVQEPS